MAGAVLGSGWLHTSGNQILDDANRPVRICAVGWQHPNLGNYSATALKMRQGGFNCVRLAFVNSIRDADLAYIDAFIPACQANGLKIIIDNHTNEPGTGPQDNWGAQQKNGLWYDVGGASDGTDGGGNTGTTSDAKWISDWVFLANKYKTNDTVCGFDLRNEPLHYGGQCTWEAGSNNPNQNLRYAYQRAAAAIQTAGYQGLIICEGPQHYTQLFVGSGIAPWGDLSAVASLPVTVSTYPNKIVYSIHDYPQDITGVNPDSGSTKVARMNTCWGYLVTGNIAPVWIGECGSNFNTAPVSPTGTAWLQTLSDYCNGRLGAQGAPTFSGTQQGIGIDWWAWGYLGTEPLNGTLDVNGNFRADQFAAYNQFLMADVGVVPPGATESPNYTQVLSSTAAPIVDSVSARWAITSGAQVSRNSVTDTRTANVVRLAYVNHLVWHMNTSNNWFYYNDATATYLPQNGTATSPLPAASPSGTVITSSSDPVIIDVAGETVSMVDTSGGQVAFNSITDGTTTAVVRIAYFNSYVYYKTSTAFWWRKARSSDVWISTTDPDPAPPASNVTHLTVQADIDAVMTELAAIRVDVGYLSP